jgi:hypothetical protein
MAGFQVGSLSNYTKTNEQMLIIKSYFEPKTASVMQKLTGVKSSIQVPSLSNDLYWQAGGTCGLINASGDTTISARVLTVGKVKAEQAFCVATLEAKYTQLLLAPGSQYESLPGGIDEAFMNTVIGDVKDKIELAIWQGDTAKWQDYLNKFDGLVKIIGAASGPVQANAAAYITPVTAVTAANVIDVMQAIYAAIPVDIINKPDLKIFIGEDISRLYITALTNANLFHFMPTDNSLGEYKLHGTNVGVIPVPGLNGQKAAYALRTSNMFLGVDLEGEDEEVKAWYSEDYDQVMIRLKFKMGVQISQTSEIVKFTW